mgnify:CR=1 FL=1
MPSRTGSASTSDNGIAVIYRDGWEDAEARAKRSEQMFKESEKEMLKIALDIVNRLNLEQNFDLKVSDIDIKFTRRQYDGLLTKSQVLTTMLNSGKIDPRLAFIACGLFTDPEEAYNSSMAYIKSQSKKANDIIAKQNEENEQENEVVEDDKDRTAS